MQRPRKALLPVAGLGTRFFPATKAQPKEMLPVFDTPAIQFIVEEAVEAGIEEIILITGPRKEAIRAHFSPDPDLEKLLKDRAKEEALKTLKKITSLATFFYAEQTEPLGDGHALLCADKYWGDEPVIVLFGDDLVDNEGGPNAVEQLLQVYDETGESVILLQQVDPSEVSKYGIVSGRSVGDKIALERLVEKPSLGEAPSDMAVVGKFLLTAEIKQALKEQAARQSTEELRLADTFLQVLERGGKIWGKPLQGRRFDTGDKLGFLQATLHYGLKREPEEVVRALQRFLEKP